MMIHCLFLVICIVSAMAREVPRLSPLPVKGESLSLNGEWQFLPKAPLEWEKGVLLKDTRPIQVPGEWVMQGFQVEKGAEALYTRTFTPPETWKDQRVKLRCKGIFSQSRIFINGKEVGSHLGGFTSFEFDVTDFISLGKENTIRIGVIADTLADSVASASKYAVHSLGGISRDISFFTLPEVNFSDFHYTTTFDAQYSDALLKVQMGVVNESAQACKNVKIQWRLKDAQGQESFLGEKVINDVPVGASLHFDQEFTVKTPQHWNPESPRLYTLTATLIQDDRVVMSSARRVGFRQIEVRGNELFVNNSPVKLRGVNRHEVMPLRGRSVIDPIWRKDVELFKQGNVNYIRTCHYPPDEALLESCDELGMFVEVEAPFCWAHETAVPDDQLEKVFLTQHLEMINRDRSHPSVLMWSLGNESNKYVEYFKKSGERIKQIDPTRPRIFSQWSPNSDNEELEIGNHHYPGPSGPEMYRDSKRPIVFDEYCHLNAYNRMELAADPGLRAMWGDILVELWDRMYRSKGVLGGALWSGIDDTFFLPGEKTVGYGTWGPIDGWRRLKPEFFGMKRAYNPILVSLKGNRDASGKVTFSIENRHDFTSLKDCKINWQAGKSFGSLSPDIAPRSQQELSFILPPEALMEQELKVQTISNQGFITAEYVFPLLPECVVHTKSASQKLKWEESPMHYTIVVGKNNYIVDKSTGLISSGAVDQKTSLAPSPTLMLLPLNGNGDGIQMTGKDQNFVPYNPLCSSWQAHSIVVEKTQGEIIVAVQGSYQEAEGQFTYHFMPTGELMVDYHFTIKMPVNPRQMGLVFHLDHEFDHLEWEREKETIVYPDEYTNAVRGKAIAYNPEIPLVGIAGPAQEPSWLWNQDQTTAGSNHFRSTKTNIKKASLSTKSGARSVHIRSQGDQSLRCWVENKNKINFLVADYNNPGTENFLRPHASLQDKPLKKGDKVSGRVILSFDKK